MGDEQHSGCLILNIPHNPGSMVGNLVTVQGGHTHTHTKKYNHYFRRISNRYCPFKETIWGIFSSQCHLQH